LEIQLFQQKYNLLQKYLIHLNHRGVAFAISYDGKRGEKTFGSKLPEDLGLKRIEIEAGRSSQATLY